MTRLFRPQRWIVSGMAVLVVCGGCDRLPWSSTAGRSESQHGVSAAPTPPRPAVLPNDVVASINGVPISRTDVELRVQDLKLQVQFANPDQEWQPLSTQDLEAVLDELIEAELMSQDVIEGNRHRSSETQQRWEFLRRRFLAEEWVRWKQDRLVLNSDIEQHYEQNKQGFREPDRIKLRQLTVATQAEAGQALARLHGESVEFADLVREMSIGPTAVQGGLINGWVMRADERARAFISEQEASDAGVISLDPVLEAAAFAIDRVGGISNDVKGPDNRYHIFQLLERQDGRQYALTEMWDGIKQLLLIDKLQQAVDRLEREAEVQRFSERLEDVSQ